MSYFSQKRDRPDWMSPCIGVCRLSESGRCLGCDRTMYEISNWQMLSLDERREVSKRFKEFRAKIEEEKRLKFDNLNNLDETNIDKLDDNLKSKD